jgi:cytochrome c oxidase subunit 4
LDLSFSGALLTVEAMMGHGHEEIQKHIKTYKLIFGALLLLSGLTVAVSYLHLPVFAAVLVALAVAGVKGTLVAGFFMHLFQEKPLILWTLLLTAFFFLVLILIPVLSR